MVAVTVILDRDAESDIVCFILSFVRMLKIRLSPWSIRRGLFLVHMERILSSGVMLHYLVQVEVLMS